MTRLLILTTLVLAGGILSGCNSTKTTTFNPSNPNESKLRVIGTVSYAECYEAARAAAQSAITSPRFDTYLAQYRREKSDEQAIPLMQVGYLKNQTRDPDLQMNLVTDELCTALMNSGRVDVTLATGRDVSQTFADARELKSDPNFNKETVAQKGTLEAPRLSLEGSIISNTVSENGTTEQVYTFNLRMADIKTGRVLWSYNKPFGTRKTRNAVGW
jgi:hypothetical protein